MDDIDFESQVDEVMEKVRELSSTEKMSKEEADLFYDVLLDMIATEKRALGVEQ